MFESICLQLRMMIEDIAVACVIANAEEMPELARGLRGEYRPTLILKGLERINPQCYPTPIVENVEGPQGHFRDTHNRPEGDWLTRAEAGAHCGRKALCCAGAASWMVIKPRPERVISSRPSAAAALTGALCATMARSYVGDGHKRGSWSHSGWTMTSTTEFRFTAHEHRNLLCRCPQHRGPGERRH